MTDLVALLARVEGATGPDREIDAEVCAAFRYMPGVELPGLAEGWEWLWEAGWILGDGPSVKAIPVRAGKRGISGSTRKPQHVTASIDAAVALAEQVLPEHDAINVLRKGFEWLTQTRGWSQTQPRGPQLALALVAAIIRAKMGEAG